MNEKRFLVNLETKEIKPYGTEGGHPVLGNIDYGWMFGYRNSIRTGFKTRKQAERFLYENA